MRIVLKISASLLLAALCLAVFWLIVLEPYRQNQFVKYANAESTTSVTFRARRAIELLELPVAWDPYLESRGQLARARVLRRLGRHDEALESYRIAIEGRLPLDQWIELALYEIELGHEKQAIDRLRVAAEFRYDFRKSIRDPRLRRQVLDLVGSD